MNADLSGYVPSNIKIILKFLRDAKLLTIATHQDPVEARFGSCYLYIFQILPLLVAGLVVLGWAIRLLFPYRPRWTVPFIEEVEKDGQELAFERKKQRQPSLVFLFFFSVCGFALAAVSIWHPVTRVEAVYPTLAWVGLASIGIILSRLMPYI